MISIIPYEVRMILESIALVALFAPLLGAIFAALFGSREKCLIAGLVPTILVFVSFFASIYLCLIIFMSDLRLSFRLFGWIESGEFYSMFGFLVDAVSVAMMATVSLVSALVHLYSIGYMKEERGFNRYFSYLSAFVFSMMLLVMSDNYLLMFAGWEGVGLCSYLLVGYYYDRPKANFASIEAFVANRIADLALIIGIFLIFITYHNFEYEMVFSSHRMIDRGYEVNAWICALLFIGAMGKSAQFPFHTWLADAMEGPTPVSALIHAATMVTAGVYLVIRSYPLYLTMADVGVVIASLGAFVAIFGASMALVNRDLKRIIAYSTLSQLGYMFVAAGLGAYYIALFHLITHAFFKALLFLGAGNVMHAMNDKLDITKMGALHKPLRLSMIMMCIASVALAGIYPFAGYFSKDLILEVAFSRNMLLWVILFISALFTAFYSARLLMLVFFVKANHNAHPHEASWYMLLAMLPLAILAIIAGFGDVLKEFTNYRLPDFNINIAHDTHIALIGLTLSAVILVILFAIFKYARGGFSTAWENNFIYKLLSNQYYIPALYEKILIKPYQKCAKCLYEVLELKIIDKFVDNLAYGIKALGKILSHLQSGSLTNMLRLMSFGLCALLIICACYFIWR